jgi:hypothetical protein
VDSTIGGPGDRMHENPFVSLGENHGRPQLRFVDVRRHSPISQGEPARSANREIHRTRKQFTDLGTPRQSNPESRLLSLKAVSSVAELAFVTSYLY